MLQAVYWKFTASQFFHQILLLNCLRGVQHNHVVPDSPNRIWFDYVTLSQFIKLILLSNIVSYIRN